MANDRAKKKAAKKVEKVVRKAVQKGLTKNAVEEAVGLGLSKPSNKKRAVGKAAVAKDARAAKRA